MPEAQDPKPNDPKQQDPKPQDPKSDGQRADGGLARAYDQIKSAEEDLARLDKLVSGLERGSESPSPRQSSASMERSDLARDKAPPPASHGRHEGLKADKPMLRAFVGLLVAICILGAAFASQYRDEAKAIVARWAPPVSSPGVSDVRSPAQAPALQLAAADEPTSVPAPPVRKEAESAPPTAATSRDQTSAEVAQSLKTITEALANINQKLEQLKSRNEQTLREQADAIQQLKTAQEQGAGDNARLAAQVQALQTQLTASSASAKPAVRSVMKENDTAARQHTQAAAPRRPRPPPRGPWMPPRYMADPYYYGDPDW